MRQRVRAEKWPDKRRTVEKMSQISTNWGRIQSGKFQTLYLKRGKRIQKWIIKKYQLG